VSHGPVTVDLYKLLPTPGNAAASEAFAKNIFSVTRQVRYSNDSGNELDLAVFINGLPVLTFELKNSLTKQTMADAIVQYQTTRDPKELLFQSGRCVAHMAVDDAEVRFCTELKGKASWFLPFNQGWNSGAGNPPNPHGHENRLPVEAGAGQGVAGQHHRELRAGGGGRRRRRQRQKTQEAQAGLSALSPVAHSTCPAAPFARRRGGPALPDPALCGQRQEQHHCMAGTPVGGAEDRGDAMHGAVRFGHRHHRPARAGHPDPRTIKGYDHVASILGHSDNAQELRDFLRRGKKIIVTTVQKFPFILDELGDLGDRKFALLIDEAHSSQGGKTTAKMHQALGGSVGGSVGGKTDEEAFEEDSTQDAVNAEIEKRIASRKLLTNASYYAFTATPKTRTLELFGERVTVGDKVQFRSPEELTYTTKQAIQEGFILDVIANYTPVDSFYHVAKTIEDDPQVRQAEGAEENPALRRVARQGHSPQGGDHGRSLHRAGDRAKKVGGKARAMIVCNGIARAIDYFREVSDYLAEIKSPYKAIVAYSGDVEMGGSKKTEADLNGFPSKDIPAKLKQDPYRFLIVANKFVTGFDEPLLHTMYVDKPLAGVLAVQTLSRLNRAHPQKADTFVLDFADNAEAVKAAFQEYYRATIQDGETDPNKLHDLKGELDAQQVYSGSKWTTWWRCICPEPTATSSTPFSMSAWPNTSASSARTNRSSSKARPRRSCAATASSPRSFHTGIRHGRSCRSS
jgi:type I restriction enzyme R subunit